MKKYTFTFSKKRNKSGGKRIRGDRKRGIIINKSEKKSGAKEKSFRAIWKSEKWGKKKVGVEKKTLKIEKVAKNLKIWG